MYLNLNISDTAFQNITPTYLCQRTCRLV